MNSMATEYKFNRGKFFLQWMLVAMLGSGIGLLINDAGPYNFLSSHINNLVFGFGFLVANVIIGYGGQKIFQHHLKVACIWFLMTLIAAIPEAILIGLIYSSMSDNSVDSDFAMILVVIVIALFCVFISSILQ